MTIPAPGGLCWSCRQEQALREGGGALGFLAERWLGLLAIAAIVVIGLVGFVLGFTHGYFHRGSP